MSEYWKSTPKYWCEHCKVYVRDTKLEKTNHESTGKHKGALSRFLRDIHKDNEREEREKQQVKDEVARLKGITTSSTPGPTVKATAVSTSASDGSKRQATAEERKQQMAQLAAMGVVVPKQYRKEVAMAGDWEVVSREPAMKPEPNVKTEDMDAKPVGGLKRIVPDQDAEDEQPRRKRIAWGSAVKNYDNGKKDEDLDALLSATTALKPKTDAENLETPAETQSEAKESVTENDVPHKHVAVKMEDESEYATPIEAATKSDNINSKVETADEAEVIFKKRKSKPKR